MSMNLTDATSELNSIPMRAESIPMLQQLANGANPNIPGFLALAKMQELTKLLGHSQQAQPPQGTIKDRIEQTANTLATQGQRMQQMQQNQMQQGLGAIGPAPQNVPQPVAQPQPEMMQEPVMAANGGILSSQIDPRLFNFAPGGIVSFSGKDGSDVKEEYETRYDKLNRVANESGTRFGPVQKSEADIRTPELKDPDFDADGLPRSKRERAEVLYENDVIKGQMANAAALRNRPLVRSQENLSRSGIESLDQYYKPRTPQGPVTFNQGAVYDPAASTNDAAKAQAIVAAITQQNAPAGGAAPAAGPVAGPRPAVAPVAPAASAVTARPPVAPAGPSLPGVPAGAVGTGAAGIMNLAGQLTPKVEDFNQDKAIQDQLALNKTLGIGTYGENRRKQQEQMQKEFERNRPSDMERFQDLLGAFARPGARAGDIGSTYAGQLKTEREAKQKFAEAQDVLTDAIEKADEAVRSGNATEIMKAKAAVESAKRDMQKLGVQSAVQLTQSEIAANANITSARIHAAASRAGYTKPSEAERVRAAAEKVFADAEKNKPGSGKAAVDNFLEDEAKIRAAVGGTKYTGQSKDFEHEKMIQGVVKERVQIIDQQLQNPKLKPEKRAELEATRAKIERDVRKNFPEPGSTGAGGSGGNTPITQAEYAKLPSGATYTAPDGTTRTKP